MDDLDHADDEVILEAAEKIESGLESLGDKIEAGLESIAASIEKLADVVDRLGIRLASQ